VNSLTREQKLLGACGANVLFIISLFFPWYGLGGVNVSGSDVVPSWWILLIFAAGAAAILAAEAFNFELPAAIDPPSWAAYLTSVTFIVTLMIFLEGSSRKIGLFLALIFSIVATVLTVMHWREEK
jgi:hypothetical protein